MKKEDKIAIQICLKRIEEHLGWGKAKDWQNQDFIRLSEIILDQTGVALSHTTLKRIWGKVSYNSDPNLTTLDTLARFSGYSDWRSFYAQVAISTERPVIKRSWFKREKQDFERLGQERTIILKSFLVLTLLLIIGVLLSGLFISISKNVVYQSDQISNQHHAKDYGLEIQKSAKGVPNSLVVDFQLPEANQKEAQVKFFSQYRAGGYLPENPNNRRTRLFYYPGAYQAHLLLGNQVVDKESFLIDTSGWLTMVERQSVPWYFRDECKGTGNLQLDINTLSGQKIDLLRQTPWVSYFLVEDFDDIHSRNFRLVTRFRSLFNQGDAICQDSSVSILLEDTTAITLPFSVSGCVAKLEGEIDKLSLNHQQSDLLAFGSESGSWVDLKCLVKDQEMRVFVNDRLALSGKLKTNSRIVGLQYRFHGLGEIDYVKLFNEENNPVVNDEFSG